MSARDQEQTDMDTGLTSFGVVLEAKHNLRRAIPSRCDVLGHVPSIFLWVNREATRETEVANLELAVGIH